jgi:hypothetical protein
MTVRSRMTPTAPEALTHIFICSDVWVVLRGACLEASPEEVAHALGIEGQCSSDIALGERNTPVAPLSCQ